MRKEEEKEDTGYVDDRFEPSWAGDGCAARCHTATSHDARESDDARFTIESFMLNCMGIYSTRFARPMSNTATKPSPLLIPSQAMSSALASAQKAAEDSGSTSRQPRRRRKPRGESKKRPDIDNPDGNAPNDAPERKQETANMSKTKQRSGKGRGRKKQSLNSNPEEEKIPEDEERNHAQRAEKKKPTRKNNRQRKRRNAAKFAWRKDIPPGSMDPITLENLVSLPYPPFALAANEPYTPVPEWPEEEGKAGEEAAQPDSDQKLTEEERHKVILQEQWGLTHTDTTRMDEPPEATQPAKRHYNLFDGRALAYYLVSQLQFIDPFNRRDLTRDELVNLDAYLTRHGFTDLKVVDAYDAKGVTISRSGAVGATAAGRAAILQQEAQVLLNALFGGGHVAENPLREQYSASQSSRPRASMRNRGAAGIADSGIYGNDDSGMILIDDDVNPGLRGTGFRSATAAEAYSVDGSTPAPSDNGPNTLWSASHITSQYSHNSAVQARNFPALPTPSGTRSDSGTSTPSEQLSVAKAPSRSLQKITQVVSKTDPEEILRQKKAREEMQRRAMLANLWLTEGATSPSPPDQAFASASGSSSAPAGPTEGQLRRNQAFAAALGVAPATVRPSFNKGWSRPTDGTIQLDEFGNELNSAKYPDSLLMQARERMEQLLKLEKKWKSFLTDDQSASLPLRPMDRPLRTFVHEYSDYWRLHTESFDPEPKRYIHCVKLRDTSAPVPLLSEAARAWRGPSLEALPRAPRQTGDTTGQQTAGQTTQSRDFPPPPEREPLKLKPRSTVPLEAPPGAMFEPPPGFEDGATTTEDAEQELSNRFSHLSTERERPKLALAPRTKPLELPPFEIPKTYSVAEEHERQKSIMADKARKEREAEQKKQNILMQAFASSDEEDLRSGGSSSEWEEKEAQVASSDESEKYEVYEG
jgi:hypothetical protein